MMIPKPLLQASSVSVEDGNEDSSVPASQVFTVTITPQNDPPALSGDYSATFDEGTSYTLTTTDLFYTDVDDNNDGVTFTASSLTNVSIQVNGSDSNSFTGTELVSGQVDVTHDDSQTTSASFNVVVEDGNEDSSAPTPQAFSITIDPVNDPPALSGDYAASFNEGASYTLTTADLFYTDVDDDNDGVTFTVSGLSANLGLEVNGSSASSFTGTRLNDSLVVFTHDGSETTSAGFNVVVEDGNEDGSSPSTQAVTFTIIPQDEAAVFSSLGGTVTFTEDGGAIALDSDALIVDDDAVYTQSTFNLTISGSDVTEDLISFSLGAFQAFLKNGSNVECNEEWSHCFGGHYWDRHEQNRDHGIFRCDRSMCSSAVSKCSV